MARSHWVVMASWASLLMGVGVACGDSVTGGEDVDPPQNDGGGKDAGADQSVSIPPKDAGTTDSNTNQPDTAPPTDGGLPSASVTSLDFGEVNCGTTGTAKTFTITNPSGAAIAWSSALGQGASSNFTIAPESGNLAAGETVTVTVTPKAVPATVASTQANGLGDNLTLTLGATNATIQLKETAHGAILYYSPASLSFGNVPTAVPAVEAAFAVANSGNAAASVTLSTTGDAAFGIVGSTTINAVPGLTASKASFDPPAFQAYTGAVAIAIGANDVLCSALPAPMPLTGTGTDGVVSTTPTSIAFGNSGLTDCGTTATAQKVRITNSSNAPITYTAVLGRGSTGPFTVGSNAASVSGSIPANSFVDVTVTPKGIPASSLTTPDLFSDTLTITTNAAGDSPHAIALQQTARGAIVARNGNFGVGDVAIGTTGTSQFSFLNSGNVPITLTFSNVLPEFSQTSPLTISANGSATALLSFSAPVNAAPLPKSYTDVSTYVPQAGVPLCGTLPGTTNNISARAVATSISASPNPVNFGFTPCGTTNTSSGLPNGARPVRITNNGPATTLTVALQKGLISPFTVSPTSSPVAAGGFVDFTITPSAIPGPPNTALMGNNAYGDVLEVSSGNNPGFPISVTINQTAQGALINYNNRTSNAFGNVKNGTTSNPVAFQINNAGNIPAEVSFFTTGNFASNPTTASMTANSSTFPNVTFSPPTAPGTVAYTGTFYATATALVMCGPLPAQPVTLTGSGTP
jgi:hypothetical protein